MNLNKQTDQLKSYESVRPMSLDSSRSKKQKKLTDSVEDLISRFGSKFRDIYNSSPDENYKNFVLKHNASIIINGIFDNLKLVEPDEGKKWMRVEEKLLNADSTGQYCHPSFSILSLKHINALESDTEELEYWKIRAANKLRTKREVDDFNSKIHPLFSADSSEFEHLSYRQCSELSAAFDIVEDYRKSKSKKKFLYHGNETTELEDFFRSALDDRVEYEHISSALEHVDDIFNTSPGCWNFSSTLEDKLIESASIKKYDTVLCDLDLKSHYDHLQEFQSVFFFFKQMHQTHKYLASDGKLIIRVPSMKHKITREILALFTLTFGEYRIVKLTSSSVGDETTYVCFKNKLYSQSSSNFEKNLFLINEKANLAIVENRRRFGRNCEFKIVLTKILGLRAYEELRDTLNIFEEHQKAVEYHMRNEFIDAMALMSKNYEVNLLSKKIISDIYYNSVNQMLAFKIEIDEVKSIEIEDLGDYPSSDEDSGVSSNPDVCGFIKTVPYDEKIGDLSDSKILSYIEPVKIIKTILQTAKIPNRIPIAEIQTTSGGLADVMASCNKQAYSVPVNIDRTELMTELSNFTDNYRKNILTLLRETMSVIDLGCGKGVDAQKFSKEKFDTYTGIDISKAQLEAFIDRGHALSMRSQLHCMNFTGIGTLPGISGNCLIWAMHTFSQLCTSKERLILWLRSNLRYNDMMLVGTFLDSAVRHNSYYNDAFKVHGNGYLMQFSVPSLVNNACELALDSDDLKNVINGCGYKCMIFDYDRFTKVEDLSYLSTELESWFEN